MSIGPSISPAPVDVASNAIVPTFVIVALPLVSSADELSQVFAAVNSIVPAFVNGPVAFTTVPPQTPFVSSIVSVWSAAMSPLIDGSPPAGTRKSA